MNIEWWRNILESGLLEDQEADRLITLRLMLWGWVEQTLHRV